jgi:hypothetical protein
MQPDNRGYLVGKFLAGVAVLCAIIILIYWRWRRKVRAGRRRLGEMMGLRIRTEEGAGGGAKGEMGDEKGRD